jgi:long-chain acyl-CoA synthetase
MRSRKFVQTKKLNEFDRFPTKIFDDTAGFDDITYQELGQRITHFGSGLRKLGMEPIPSYNDECNDLDAFNQLDGQFKLVIFENTCAMWTIALQGALSQSMTVATCYATLGIDAVTAAVQETKATALLVNWKDVDTFVARAHEMPSLKFLIASLNECGTAGYSPPPPSSSHNLQVVTVDDVLKLGKESPYDPTPPKVR